MNTLYRKYRPQNFMEVAGQGALLQLLKNTLQQNKLHHAYLFTGPRGTGKTSIARILAKAINCTNAQNFEPCNQCEACTSITAGTCVDVFEIDAASNRGIEEIRDLREKIRYLPVQVAKKIYIIDEVHMLTNEAFNALLKTLEEPPSHVVFILATTELHKVPLTIRSRCQQLDFHPLKVETIAAQLQKVSGLEKINLPDDVAQAVARHSRGGMRDALSLLDQLRSFCVGRSITLADFQSLMGGISPDKLQELVQSFGTKNLEKLLSVSNQLLTSGTQLSVLIDQLLEAFEIILLIKLNLIESIDRSPEEIKIWQGIAANFQTAQLQAFVDRFLKLRSDLRYEIQPKLIWELFLIKECEGITQAAAPAPTPVAPVPKTKIEPTQTISPAPQVPAATIPPTPSQTIELSLTLVLSRWDEILNTIKQKKVQTFMLMSECSPVALVGQILTLQFKKNYQFHMEKLTQSPHKEVIGEALKSILNAVITVKAEIEGDEVVQKAPAQGAEAQILSVFGGKVL